MPPPELLLGRAELARMLNAINGCSMFTMFNVQFIPQAELDQLFLELSWKKSMDHE